MATILITGGTGLIGSALAQKLSAEGQKIIILTRSAKAPTTNLVYKQWDVEKGSIDESAVADADAIVHLAGANVADGRWTEKRKKEIVDSRVKSGALLVKALKEIPNKVTAVVSASAIGWYGPDPQVPNPRPFVETDPADNAFLGRTCRAWEEAIRPVTALGKRLVVFRTGIVLSNQGGAYAEFKKPLAFGVAGVLGSGKQVVSWLHLDDAVRMYAAAVENENWQGVYNAVAPQPVSNKELITTMAKERGRFHLTVPVPSFALKIALGEMSVEVLKSATVSAEKIAGEGFRFLYPNIDAAVQNLEPGK